MEYIPNASEGEVDNSEISDKPTGERWAPLGANDADESSYFDRELGSRYCSPEAERLQDLEEQQELLNSSLLALTTHFAQVQLRLSQIVEAPPSEKEHLLKDLEAFAFRGIPEVQSVAKSKNPLLTCNNITGDDLEEKMSAQRAKQKELISQLKTQLEDLEKYAYETGEAGLPQSVIMERQCIIIDQLKGKLNLNVDDMSKMTVEDLRHQVDCAISQVKVYKMLLPKGRIVYVSALIMVITHRLYPLQRENQHFKMKKRFVLKPSIL